MLVLLDRLHSAHEPFSRGWPGSQRTNKVEGDLYAGYALVVLGAGLEPVGGVIGGGVEPVDIHAFE